MAPTGTAVTDTDELAQIFSVTRKTIRRWIREKKLPAVRIGHSIILSNDVLLAAKGGYPDEGGQEK